MPWWICLALVTEQPNEKYLVYTWIMESGVYEVYEESLKFILLAHFMGENIKN